MSRPMTADQFIGMLQLWGVPYEIWYPNWKTHNHNDKQPWDNVHGVLLHHTGDDVPDKLDGRVLYYGRSDLPGPLCQWGMTDLGTVIPIGWGNAYHAGEGAQNVLNALIQDNPIPAPGPDAVNGNPQLYGQETMYSGSHEPTVIAYSMTVLVFAGICSHHGWSANSVLGHKEWTRRKWDPGTVDMDLFRHDVQKMIDRGPIPRKPTPKPVPVPVPEPTPMETDVYQMLVYQVGDAI